MFSVPVCSLCIQSFSIPKNQTIFNVNWKRTVPFDLYYVLWIKLFLLLYILFYRNWNWEFKTEREQTRYNNREEEKIKKEKKNQNGTDLFADVGFWRRLKNNLHFAPFAPKKRIEFEKKIKYTPKDLSCRAPIGLKQACWCDDNSFL